MNQTLVQNCSLTPNEITEKVTLNCARWGLPNFNTPILENIPKDKIEWEDIISAAGSHGLLPLLYLAAKDSDQLRSMPEKIEKELRKKYLITIANSLMANWELSAILAKFNDKNIPTIVLKGPFLAENTYSQKGVRPYADLDILVKKEDLPSIQLLLAKLGYEQLPEVPRFRWEEEYPEKTFTKNGSRSLPVEIQWDILDKTSYLKSMNFDVSEIWEKASKVEINGQPTLKMAPEHLLIYLCLHLSVTHHFERLVWLRDLAEVLNFYQNSFDWNHFKECVLKWEARTYVYYPLLMANKFLGTRIPENVLDDIRPRYFAAGLFEKKLDGANMVRFQKRSFANTLFLILRDKPYHRCKAILALPYQAIRWRLKGRTR